LAFQITQYLNRNQKTYPLVLVLSFVFSKTINIKDCSG
jgi:hypothetical protein